MSYKPETLLGTMTTRSDPTVFRFIAAFLTAFSALLDMYLGGSWVAACLAAILFGFMCFLSPSTSPRTRFQSSIAEKFYSVRRTSLLIQGSAGALLIVFIAILAPHISYYGLGREYNFYLLPICIAAFLFDFRIAVLVWFASGLACYYCAIPPRYSFGLASLKEWAEVLGFFYLGLAILTVPIMIRASAWQAEKSKSVASRELADFVGAPGQRFSEAVSVSDGISDEPSNLIT